MAWSDELDVLHEDCNEHFGVEAVLSFQTAGAFNNATMKHTPTTVSQDITIDAGPTRSESLAGGGGPVHRFSCRVKRSAVTIGGGVPLKGWALTIRADGNIPDRECVIERVEYLSNRTEFRLTCAETAGKGAEAAP